MARYVARRVLMLIPMLRIVIFIVSFIMYLTPSDPGTLILGERATPEAISQLNRELGYNDPFLVRYVKYVWNAARGEADPEKRKELYKKVVNKFMEDVPFISTFAFKSAIPRRAELTTDNPKSYQMFDYRWAN
jgi:peptide/nickel transport system permease protein